MRRTLLAGILGGVVSFAWGILAWEVATRAFEELGRAPPPPAVALYSRELLICVAVATLLAALLAVTAVALPRFVQRLLFVAVMGSAPVCGALALAVNRQIVPLDVAVIAGSCAIVQFLLVGAVLAWRIAPPPPRETMEIRARAALT